MTEAIKASERITLDHVGIFADGVAVRQVGAEPFRIAQQCVDEMIVVNTDEICAAIKDIFDETRTIAEPAGALSIAGLKKYVENTGCTQQNFVATISGANINFDRLRHVAERVPSEVGLAKGLSNGRAKLLKAAQQIGQGNWVRFKAPTQYQSPRQNLEMASRMISRFWAATRAALCELLQISAPGPCGVVLEIKVYRAT